MSRRGSRRKRRRRFGFSAALRLVIGAVLVIAVERYLFLHFQPHDPRSGWLVHFFIGATVGLVGMMVWLVEERRPVPLPVLWILIGHLLAMFPDLLFAAGIAHRHWMDAFLGHLISHRVPGGTVVWYAVFLVALGAYLALDVRIRSAQSARGRRHRQAGRAQSFSTGA